MSRAAFPKPGREGKTPARGFVCVNMPAWREKDLRALVECYGIPFRSFLYWAVNCSAKEIERLTGLTQEQCMAMTKKERRAFAARLRAAWRAIGYYIDARVKFN
jgi:hypothetical protein